MKNSLTLFLLIKLYFIQLFTVVYGFSCSKLAHKPISETYRFTEVFIDIYVFLRKYVKTINICGVTSFQHSFSEKMIFKLYKPGLVQKSGSPKHRNQFQSFNHLNKKWAPWQHSLKEQLMLDFWWIKDLKILCFYAFCQ